MSLRFVIVLLGAGLLVATAQTNPPAPAPALPVTPAADWQQWLAEQTDALLRNALAQLDEEEAIKALDQLFTQFQQGNPDEIDSIRTAAAALVPWLEQNEETLPYALWLRTRLDYFDVPRLTPRPITSRPATNSPPTRAEPAPVSTIWDEKLADRPPPPLAAQHLAVIRRAFTDEGVPAQLVWIAEVESSFDPRAKSPAGAVGLFQITKRTAESLGLSTWWPDERRHPEKSARAAARYLRYLYTRFRNWPLVLAAYNAGETRVASLLRETGGTSFKSIASRLPQETRMYVPKVEAVVRKREAVELAELPPPKP